MADVAVLLKTTGGREEALLTCLRSAFSRLGEQGLSHRLYLADDAPAAPEKKEIYHRLRDRGHVVVEVAEEGGVSAARNELVDRLRGEEYVLRMDDDFELTGETDVVAMRSILQRVPSVGVLGDLERQIGLGKGVFSGQISDAQGFFERRGDVLVRRLLPPDAFEYEKAGSQRFARCDFTRNFLLIRREVLDEVRWDDRLAFAGEHADFLLQVRESKWDTAFTPDSIHRHRDDLGSASSGGILDRKQVGAEAERRVYREKWGVEGTTARRSLARTSRAAVVRVGVLGRRVLAALS